MSTGHLTIDLHAIAENWRALDNLSGPTVETGATVKANAYGLGSARVSRILAEAGVRSFFVAVAEEGEKIRRAIGPGPQIFVYGGHMPGDAERLRALDLIPLLNSIEQLTDHMEQLPRHPFGVQLDTGMNRLGLEPAEWTACRAIIEPLKPKLVMSHLARADEPKMSMNARQRKRFVAMTADLDAPLSLAATGGILLNDKFHFDMVRPGVGLYGGLPFTQALPVAYLALPVIQTRDVQKGETVGYGNTWKAKRPSRIATVAAGYADGLIRASSNRMQLYADKTPCPVVGRVSMDLITVDVTDLDEVPSELDVLGVYQTVDDVAACMDTIGYEVLTSLGGRYARYYESAV